jgi:hypothetical protein
METGTIMSYKPAYEERLLEFLDNHENLFDRIEGLERGEVLYYAKNKGLLSINKFDSTIKISSTLQDKSLLNELEKLIREDKN